jgi:aminoglycoside phosphotransferase (APT) family kinase protein
MSDAGGAAGGDGTGGGAGGGATGGGATGAGGGAAGGGAAGAGGGAERAARDEAAGGTAAAGGDVVHTREEAATLGREPLLVLEPLAAVLDKAGIGSGAIAATPIGDGHSNVTYLLSRGSARVVLRRPPRGPLPPSAHDVLREARLLRQLRPAGVRVPEVLAVCDDVGVIGAPFYVMAFVAGEVLSTGLPVALAGGGRAAREAIGFELVDALAELHAVDLEASGLASFGRPSGYLERQVRRFSGLLEQSATRPLPLLEQVADWLAANRPASPPTTIVHGDYRLGNVMFAGCGGDSGASGDRGSGAAGTSPASPRLTAILDWELATLGDPLADLGYLAAMWAEPDDPPNPMLDLSAVTRQPGFPTRAQLAARYAERTGRDASSLGWYQVLALWKSAIFLEGSYKRYLAGSTDDAYFARLGDGVPVLAETAWRRAQAM